jgi:hypothetical protein
MMIVDPFPQVFSVSSAIFSTTTALPPLAAFRKVDGGGARAGNSPAPSIQRRGSKSRHPFSGIKRKVANRGTAVTTTVSLPSTSTTTEFTETSKSVDNSFFDSNEIQVPVLYELQKTSKSGEDKLDLSSELPAVSRPADVTIESHGSKRNEQVDASSERFATFLKKDQI